MCPNSYVYTVEDLVKMNCEQLGQAIWEYENDPVIEETVEMCGGIEQAAAEIVACFFSTGVDTDTARYIVSLGAEYMTAAVISYLERNI